jgi:hypothetical protein
VTDISDINTGLCLPLNLPVTHRPGVLASHHGGGPRRSVGIGQHQRESRIRSRDLVQRPPDLRLERFARIGGTADDAHMRTGRHKDFTLR